VNASGGKAGRWKVWRGIWAAACAPAGETGVCACSVELRASRNWDAILKMFHCLRVSINATVSENDEVVFVFPVKLRSRCRGLNVG
jgi:hypothetical protein